MHQGYTREFNLFNACIFSEAWRKQKWNSDDDCDVVLLIISRSPSSCCTWWPCRSWAGPWSCPRPASRKPSSWRSIPADTGHEVTNIRLCDIKPGRGGGCGPPCGHDCAPPSRRECDCVCVWAKYQDWYKALNITLPTCEHGHGCASGRLHGYGLRCAQTHGCKAGNTFKFQFMTIDGIHLANIFLAFRW